MPSRFLDVTDRANTVFGKNIKGLWIIITVLFIVSASLVAIIYLHFLKTGTVNTYAYNYCDRFCNVVLAFNVMKQS